MWKRKKANNTVMAGVSNRQPLKEEIDLERICRLKRKEVSRTFTTNMNIIPCENEVKK